MNRTVSELTDGWIVEGMDLHEGIQRRAYVADYTPKDGLACNAPCTVRQALLQHGLIPDPYKGTNSKDTKWIEDREWWFFNTFDAPRVSAGEKLFLRFEGITYRAEVFLNGVQLGQIEGMFRRDDFDITSLLVRGKNRISIRMRTFEQASWDDEGGPRCGVIQPMGPVVQCLYRWNWVQHLVPVGIWQPVKLVAETDVSLDAVRVHTLKVDTRGGDGFAEPEADARVRCEWVLSNKGQKPSSVDLSWRMDGKTFRKRGVAAGKLRVKIPARGTVTVTRNVSVSNAKLWWCNGLGTPHLHSMETVVRSGKRVLLKEDTSFGIRTIVAKRSDRESYVRKVTGQTNRPWSMVGEVYPWHFEINGRYVFLKGSNWVPVDGLLRLDHELYDRFLLPARESGINFLRVWGGGLAETDTFYELCDRYGIMCWQEFWLACADYPVMKHELFIRCVRDTVRRIAPHPSLVFYSGGNEFEPDNAENRILVDKVADQVAEVDPNREFRRGSPYKGDRHGGLLMMPFGTRNKYMDILRGDARLVLFRSEIAVGRSLPMPSSLDRFLPRSKRLPIDEDLWRHFFAVPPEIIAQAEEYDALDEFDYTLYSSYLALIQINRYNLGFCRAHMRECGGNLNWQWNTPFPGMHRDVIDMWGTPKPAFYTIKNYSRSTVLYMDYEKYVFDPGERFKGELYVANDGPSPGEVKARVRIFSVDSRLLHDVTVRAAVPENGSCSIGSIDFTVPADMAGNTLLAVTELSAGRRVLHCDMHWLAVSMNPVSETSLCLDGKWRRKEGGSLVLPGNDMKMPRCNFLEAMGGHELVKDLASKKGRQVPESPVVYVKRFRLPAALRDVTLEFYCAGFEASDEVILNGRKIGGHAYRPARFDVGARTFVPYGKKNAQIEMDPDSEYPALPDPIIQPRLASRFYDIPSGCIRKTGVNEIQVVIKSRFQKVCYNSMFIRPRTSKAQRGTIGAYAKGGVFFKDLRHMPRARVQCKPLRGGVRVTNTGDQIAFLVMVEILDKSHRSLPLTDNAFHLLPGESRVVKPMTTGKRAPATSAKVFGWNIPRKPLVLGKR